MRNTRKRTYVLLQTSQPAVSVASLGPIAAQRRHLVPTWWCLDCVKMAPKLTLFGCSQEFARSSFHKQSLVWSHRKKIKKGCLPSETVGAALHWLTDSRPVQWERSKVCSGPTVLSASNLPPVNQITSQLTVGRTPERSQSLSPGCLSGPMFAGQMVRSVRGMQVTFRKCQGQVSRRLRFP